MNFSSVMEEAEGRHYEVRFSSTQRWAVAAIVLLALAIAYLACEVVITVLSVVEPRLTGVAWGGQVVPLEALWPVRCVVLTALVEAFLVVNLMIRTHVTIDRARGTMRSRSCGAIVAAGWWPSCWARRLPGQPSLWAARAPGSAECSCPRPPSWR